MHPSIQIFNEAVREFINTDFEVETLSDNCKFTEGPLWNREGFYLFSDIAANTAYRIVPGQEKEVFIAQSGTESLFDPDIKADQAGSNAMAYDNEGSLLVCRHGSHMVGRWNGELLEPFITAYKEKPFNSPNDLIVDKKGRVFFSDPPYGLKDGKLNPEKFQPIAGVYCYDKGEITLICDKYQYPNGVCITPDGKSLYICSNKPFERFISVYDLDTLQFQKTLAAENGDGMKCDPYGNVYLGTNEGLLILDERGNRLALIKFPTIPANHCFGGGEKKDLFITSRENIFLIRNLLR